jgi:sugar lactone lactonase YvrE
VITGLSRTDSFCLDAAGNFYVGTGGGLRVFRSDASEVTLLAIPAGSPTQGTTSCGFGGADGKTLYITNWSTLFRVEGMPIPGLDWQVNQARVDCSGS